MRATDAPGFNPEGLRGRTGPPSFEDLADFGGLDTFESSPIGAYLRRQRLLRDLSLEELSQLTRIPLRSLERLESGEFDGETDGFARGFVRTVSIALGLDADETISRMLQEPGPGAWERRAPGRRLKQGFVLTVAAVGVLLAFLLLQAGWSLLVSGRSTGPGAEVVLWRDPVRSLAEAAGAAIDPASEIAPVSASGEGSDADLSGAGEISGTTGKAAAPGPDAETPDAAGR